MARPFDAYHRFLGIPPEEQPPNHYRLLGLKPFESDDDVIETAADRQMIHLRTFQTGKHAEQSQRLLNEVAAARLCLLNPHKKAAYDGELRQRFQAAAAVPTPPPAPPQAPAGPPIRFEQVRKRYGKAADESPAAKKKSLAKSWIIGGSAAAAVLLLLAAVLGVWALCDGEKPRSKTQTELVFDWPQDQRADVILFVGRKAFRFPDCAPLRVPCEPGKYRIRAGRTGFKPFEVTVEVKAGEQKEVAAVWVPQSYVVLQWPHSKRRGATLKIDGGVIDLFSSKVKADSKTVKVPLDAGEHTVRIEQSGCDPFERPLKIDEGKDLVVEVGLSVNIAQTPGTGGIEVPAFGEDQPDGGRSLADLLDKFDSGSNTPDGSGDCPGAEPAAPSPQRPQEKKKHPVPSDAVQAEIAAELPPPEANTPAEKLRLARKRLILAAKSEEPQKQFVLLRTAADLARGGGDAALMLRAIDALDTDFEIDVLAEKEKGLTSFAEAAGDTAAFASFAESSREVIDQALAHGRYESALHLSEKAYRFAPRLRDKELRTRTRDRHREVERAYQSWKEFQKVLVTLESNPQDADANLTAGRWYCFARGDWDQALPFLAKGSDEALGSVAKQELASPPDAPSDQVEAGDAWWEVAEASRDAERDALMRRAGYWYRQAAPQLTAAEDKAKLTERLVEIVKIGYPPSKPAKNEITFNSAQNVTFLRALPSQIDGVGPIALSPEGSILASVIGYKVRLWNIVTLQQLGNEFDTQRRAYCMTFSPDGSVLAWSGEGNMVKYWPMPAGPLKHMREAHTDHVNSIAFSPDGSTLATGSRDTRVILWDLARGYPRGTIQGHQGVVTSVAFSPDGSMLASASIDKTVSLWDVATGRLIRTMPVQPDEVHYVVFSPFGSTLASRCRDGTVGLWDPATGEPRRTSIQKTELVKCLAFSPDGSLMATGGGDWTVKLWNVFTGELLFTFEGHQGPVSCVTFSPDGTILASSSGDKTVRFWGVAARRK